MEIAPHPILIHLITQNFGIEYEQSFPSLRLLDSHNVV